MYRFKFLSKKYCFKLKLIAPKSSPLGVAAHVIFAPNTHRHIHVRRTRVVLCIYGLYSNSKDTAYIAHSCEHRERQSGAQCDLWAYIILVTYSDVFSAPKPIHSQHTIFFGFEFRAVATAAIAENTVFRMLIHFNILYFLWWKFIIGCNSACVFVAICSSHFSTLAHTSYSFHFVRSIALHS